MSEQTELSDEALADIVHRAFNSSDENLDPNHDPWLDVARALREALCPPVAPLAPGETETIADVWVSRDTLAVQSDVTQKDRRVLSFTITNVMEDDDEEIALVYLDAAGVARLEATCRRWRAAQGEGQ